MTSTPSDSSDRTSDWAPVTDSATGLVGVAGAAGWCALTPAATVSGDGAFEGGGVVWSGGVLVMASMPSLGTGTRLGGCPDMKRAPVLGTWARASDGGQTR